MYSEPAEALRRANTTTQYPTDRMTTVASANDRIVPVPALR